MWVNEDEESDQSYDLIFEEDVKSGSTSQWMSETVLRNSVLIPLQLLQ